MIKFLLLRLLLVTDERDRESTTLGFVAIAFLVLVIKFGLGGFFGFPEISAGDFGLAFAGILGVWIAKNWSERSNNAKVEVAEVQAKAVVDAAKEGVAVPTQGDSL